MTAPVCFDAADAVEIVELLRFVADVSETDPVSIDAALERFVGNGYEATDLRSDARRLADSLAQAMGFADGSLESAR